MSEYRKKPVVIEARQFYPDVFAELRAWVGPDLVLEPLGGTFHIHTLEGPHRVSPGDFIIRGVKGEFYPCKPDIFAATYEPAAPPPPAAGTGTPDRVAELTAELEQERRWHYEAADNHHASGIREAAALARAENAERAGQEWLLRMAKAEAERDEARREADRRTREVELTYQVQKQLTERLASAEAEVRRLRDGLREAAEEHEREALNLDSVAHSFTLAKADRFAARRKRGEHRAIAKALRAALLGEDGGTR